MARGQVDPGATDSDGKLELWVRPVEIITHPGSVQPLHVNVTFDALPPGSPT